MDFFSVEFFSALAAIVVIDIVLAGDNAIVIALAARNIPRNLQRRAIVWGTAGAVVVRTLLTLVVVWLLKVPGLLLAGGLLLSWIAFRLVAPAEPDGDHAVAPAASFWGAMKTIVVADAVMGLDNVLAVAGAAQGSFILVALGLLISIPIVVGGSTVILHFVDRYPGIVYAGAAVLAWTAAKMVASEPFLSAYLEGRTGVSVALQVGFAAAIIALGYLRNRRVAKRRVPRSPGVAATEPAGQEAGAGRAVARAASTT